MPSKTWCCRLGLSFTAVIKSPIKQSMWERLFRVWGGTGPVSVILEMMPYLGIRSDVRKREFDRSVSVYKNSQNNLDEYNQTIGRKRSMQMIMSCVE